ncbi:MAG: hypothetical protein V2A54_01430, partial [Bacteroidota bacterium]
CISKNSKFATTEVPFFLSDSMVVQKQTYSIIDTSKYDVSAFKIPVDTISVSGRWKKACLSFKAKGNESYLIIGNTDPASKPNFIMINKKTKRKNNYVYMFIDDVSVTKSDLKSDCNCRSVFY